MSTRPFFPWCGGKYHTIGGILPYVPNTYNNYYEPFLGAGSMLYALQPKKAFVNDINLWVIALHVCVKEDLQTFVKTQCLFDKKNNRRKNFYNIMSDFNKYIEKNGNTLSTIKDMTLQSSRFYYILKKCYGGKIWFNDKYLNSSFCPGLENTALYNSVSLEKISVYLNTNNISFSTGEYTDLLLTAKKGDFIYLDPPYYKTCIGKNIGKYNKNIFGESDHILLAKLLIKLNKKGCKFLLSNCYHTDLIELYKDFDIIKFKVDRPLRKNRNDESKYNEILVKNY
jgi:DNA adenine methylase